MSPTSNKSLDFTNKYLGNKFQNYRIINDNELKITLKIKNYSFNKTINILFWIALTENRIVS